MNLPSQSTINAVIRHGVTAAGTAAAVLAIVGLTSSGDTSKIVDAVNQIGTGLQQVVTGVGVLVGIASAAYAGWTATHKQQVASVTAAVASGEISKVETVKAIQAAPTPLSKGA
jgi:hypothetical protein